MAYFDCIVGGSGKGNTVTVTCAEEFAGLTITLAKTGKTYTKTCPSTAPYVVSFYGVENGTYTVSGTVDGETYSQTVVVQDISCVLNYGFTWQTWVDTASQLDSSDYENLNEVLADEKALRELFLEHACVDYMASMGVFNEDLETVINNDLCAKWINLSDYALDFLHANEVIADLMDEADKYGYGEWALMPQVPNMISNTAPYGTASASSIASTTYDAYKAFDNDASTRWIASNGVTNNYLAYEFISSTRISKVSIVFYFSISSGYTAPSRTFILQGYDGATWVDIETVTTQAVSTSTTTLLKELEISGTYEGIRLFCSDSIGVVNQWNIGILSLQFYAWAPKGNVPVMTSNTAPYGTASASSTVTNFDPWEAFDDIISASVSASWWASTKGATPSTQYLQYKFVNPICVKRVVVNLVATDHPVATVPHDVGFSVLASNDGTNWETLKSVSFTASQVESWETIELDNDSYYLYYRIGNFTGYVYTAATTDNYVSCNSLQFYGRELKVSVPTMTSNTAPYGEAFSNTVTASQYDAFKAFDNNESTDCRGQATEHYSGYDFGEPVAIKMMQYYIDYFISVKIQYSDDKQLWNDASDVITMSSTATQKGIIITNINENHRYWRFFGSQSGSGNGNRHIVQFYGLDYSEKEFEEGATKKWLYDHGVELEEITEYNQSGVYTEKTEHSLVKTKGGSGNYTAGFVAASVDLTNYNLLRAKIGKDIDCSSIVYLSVRADATPAYGATSVAQYVFANSNDVPNNVSLDISNVNQSLYASMFSKITAGIFELVELWLE